MKKTAFEAYTNGGAHFVDVCGHEFEFTTAKAAAAFADAMQAGAAPEKQYCNIAAGLFDVVRGYIDDIAGAAGLSVEFGDVLQAGAVDCAVYGLENAINGAFAAMINLQRARELAPEFGGKE